MRRLLSRPGFTGSLVVTAQSLSVAPALVGCSLATPARLLAAMGIDL